MAVVKPNASAKAAKIILIACPEKFGFNCEASCAPLPDPNAITIEPFHCPGEIKKIGDRYLWIDGWSDVLFFNRVGLAGWRGHSIAAAGMDNPSFAPTAFGT
jgi:hypothetical protein